MPRPGTRARSSHSLSIRTFLVPIDPFHSIPSTPTAVRSIVSTAATPRSRSIVLHLLETSQKYNVILQRKREYTLFFFVLDLPVANHCRGVDDRPTTTTAACQQHGHSFPSLSSSTVVVVNSVTCLSLLHQWHNWRPLIG